MKINVKNNNTYIKRIISINKYKHKIPLFYNFIIILFIIYIKVFNAYQEIKIIINGTDTQQILNNEYFNGGEPNQILINGILQNYTDYFIYNLTENNNVITMRWDIKLTSCNYMFEDLKNITEFDFSNFDTSKVEGMHWMFYGLNSLKILDLSNFNTSSVTNMDGMFYECYSLVSLNLNNFDTSNVENMDSMFAYLNSLITIRFK